MATSSSTFNFSAYEGGNYFLLYVCIVYNSNNVAPTPQVRQLLVINEQLDIFIYFFPLLRAFEFPPGFKLLRSLTNCRKMSSGSPPPFPHPLGFKAKANLPASLAVWPWASLLAALFYSHSVCVFMRTVCAFEELCRRILGYNK